jgi:hypothetical protein
MTEEQVKTARRIADLWTRQMFEIREKYPDLTFGEDLLATSMRLADSMRMAIHIERPFDLTLIDSVIGIMTLDVYRQLEEQCPGRVTDDVRERIAEIELERARMEQLINETYGNA